MENKTKKRPLAISLLWVTAAFAVAGLSMALLTTTIQGFTANASTPTDATETNQSIASRSSNNNAIILAEKPVLVEDGKTVAATPINQTHMQISLVGNGTITLPNSTETVTTKDTGNAVARLTSTGNIVHGQIHISTEDGSENGTVFFTEIGQNGKGVGVAYFTTNSTGKLAFLDNMVAVIEDELQPNGNTIITAWEWRGEE
jgi:cytoskeletal protein RodZ